MVDAISIECNTYFCHRFVRFTCLSYGLYYSAQRLSVQLIQIVTGERLDPGKGLLT